MSLSWSNGDSNWDRILELFDLKCTQNPALIKLFLDSTIDMTNGVETFERREMIESVARENIYGYNAVIEFVENYHKDINSKV